MSKKEIDEDLYDDLMGAEHDRDEMRRQYEDFQEEKRKLEQAKKEEKSSEFLKTIGKLLTDTSSDPSSDDSRYGREIERSEEEQKRLAQEAAERDAYYNYLNRHLDDDEDDYEEFTDTYDNINKEYGNYAPVEEEPDVFTDIAPLSPEDKEREQDHISNAVAMTEDGDFAQAKNEYNKALKINPDNYRAIFGIAKCEVKFKYDTGYEIPYNVDDKYGKLAKNMRLSVLEKGALKAKQALSHGDASEEEKTHFLNEMAVTLYLASLVFMIYFLDKVNGGKHDDDYLNEYSSAEIDSIEHLEFAFGIISDLADELSKTNVIKIKNHICIIYANYTYNNPGYYYLIRYKKYRDELKGKVPSDARGGYTEANPFSREASKKMSYTEKQAAIKQFWEKVDEVEKVGSVADLHAIAKEIEERIIGEKEEAERIAKEKQAKESKKKEAERIAKEKQAEEYKKKEVERRHNRNIFFAIATIVVLIIGIVLGVSSNFLLGIFIAAICEVAVIAFCKLFFGSIPFWD